MISQREKNEILGLLESRVKVLQGPSKIEKLQMTKRIRRTVDATFGIDVFTPEQIITRLEHKLSGIFSLFPYGFKKDLEKMIREIMKR
ncbi:MAG: hypothetical protein JRK53_28240 [Deltaproteobacteria bacterium]|nr:hypothetical protein [Deltaproteobacteria bacterium]